MFFHVTIKLNQNNSSHYSTISVLHHVVWSVLCLTVYLSEFKTQCFQCYLKVLMALRSLMELCPLCPLFHPSCWVNYEHDYSAVTWSSEWESTSLYKKVHMDTFSFYSRYWHWMRNVKLWYDWNMVMRWHSLWADMQRRWKWSENGTYEYSSSISTSTKTMIPTLEMFWWGNKTTNRLKSAHKLLHYVKQNIKDGNCSMTNIFLLGKTLEIKKYIL